MEATRRWEGSDRGGKECMGPREGASREAAMAEKSVSNQSMAMQTAKAYTGKKFRVAFIGCGGVSQMHMTDHRRP